MTRTLARIATTALLAATALAAAPAADAASWTSHARPWAHHWVKAHPRTDAIKPPRPVVCTVQSVVLGAALGTEVTTTTWACSDGTTREVVTYAVHEGAGS